MHIKAYKVSLYITLMRHKLLQTKRYETKPTQVLQTNRCGTKELRPQTLTLHHAAQTHADRGRGGGDGSGGGGNGDEYDGRGREARDDPGGTRW